MKIIILGINGMIGSSIFIELSKNFNLEVLGTLRKVDFKSYFDSNLHKNILYFEELNNINLLLDKHKPNIIINCIGITKHAREINNIQNSIFVNSIFPHNLKDVCKNKNIRLIHISSDCVFLGQKGDYKDYDNSDCLDLYGKSKALGEINDDKSVTIRTSTIGHELNSSFGLLEWFLLQKEECEGYKNAIFSGLTNIELSKVIMNKIIPNKNLTGIYNVGGNIISKFCLLEIIKSVYKKNINIKVNKEFVIDRSLNSNLFCSKTSYYPPSWIVQVEEMYKIYLSRKLSDVKK